MAASHTANIRVASRGLHSFDISLYLFEVRFEIDEQFALDFAQASTEVHVLQMCNSVPDLCLETNNVMHAVRLDEVRKGYSPNRVRCRMQTSLCGRNEIVCGFGSRDNVAWSIQQCIKYLRTCVGKSDQENVYAVSTVPAVLYLLGALQENHDEQPKETEDSSSRLYPRGPFATVNTAGGVEFKDSRRASNDESGTEQKRFRQHFSFLFVVTRRILA
jgi:hypothetical protein